MKIASAYDRLVNTLATCAGLIIAAPYTVAISVPNTQPKQ